MDFRSKLSPTRVFWGVLVVLFGCFVLPAPSVVSIESPVSTRRTEPVPSVWLVEETESHELYSNGLRVESAYAVSNERRFYQALRRSHNDLELEPEWRSQPAGIVYHSTESQMVPFEAGYNGEIRRASLALLRLLQRNRSYNYLIDRFGRVFRVVHETDAANHAGNSVWGDAFHVYMNLNASFLAVAFEAQTRNAGGYAGATAAQIHAGRVLTQMLRDKYGIVPGNCVTHAQVSVNPSNMRIGYHTDWARNFPFVELGLGNNYDLPPASITDFGFAYDADFLVQTGGKPWPGLEAASARLSGPVEILRERYKKLYAALSEN